MDRVSFQIRVQKTGHTYFPEEIRRAGFTGDLEGLPNSCTFLLVKPDTSTEDIIRSLRFHIQHLGVRKEKISVEEDGKDSAK